MSDINDNASLISKVLVLDSNVECYDKIKSFCEANNLVGLKVQENNVLSVLKSNIDLGGILLSESYFGSVSGGIELAREIHQIRPELPIFLRLEETGDLEKIDPADRKLFSVCYSIDQLDHLRSAIETSLFSLHYPNALVRGIAELTTAALESQFRGMSVYVEPPYIIRDRIIFGEMFTLIPIESNWCRGYMMLQTEEAALLHLVQMEKTYAESSEAGDFRNLNNVLGEITNLVWGSFKNRYVSYTQNNTYMAQVPIIINHLHRYISFGSENPQLCFKYTLNSLHGDEAASLVIYQKFVFNLNWSPVDFKENEISVEDMFASGELELF